MFKEYFTELKDLQVYETEKGFILFRIAENHLYLADVYIKPEFRRNRNSFSMVDDLITETRIENNYNYLLCDVEPSNINATIATKTILAYGFQVVEAHHDEIIFVKVLDG